MLKISVIGIGNAGNQIAELAKKTYGIDGFAINSSDKDISTITAIPKIVIGDEKGSGKDRNIAKEFIQQAARDLLTYESFKKQVDESEVVFVISSTGGGTGSGTAPVLTDVLTRMFPAKKFIMVGILPPLKESIAAQQNTIEYLKETRNFNPTYLLYDNNCRVNLTPSEMMLEINKEVVEDLAVIRGDYQLTTPYNSIDEKDMLKIIETSGRVVVTRVVGLKEKDIDDKGIEDRLITALRNSAHAELDRDHIIKRIGLITNLNEKLQRSLDTNLPAFKELIGEPIEGFEHVYLNKSEDEVNRVFTVASGLSVPDDRIEKIMQRIEEATAQLSKTKESSILDDASTDFLDMLRDSTKDSKKASTLDELDDIFGQYTKK